MPESVHEPLPPADPARVRTVLDRIGPTEVAALRPEVLDAVVAVAASSDSLGDLIAEDPAALASLDRLDEVTTLRTDDVEALVHSHRLGLLHIAARDLLGRIGLHEVVDELSALRAGVVQAALELADAPELVVVGMGKFGAGELNYVSDIDVVFVSEAEHDEARRSTRRLLDVVGRCIRVDTDLRPGGRSGEPVRTLRGYTVHWDRWAAPWEFQALLKARTIAGPADARDAVDEAIGDALWSREFDGEDLRAIRRLKARSEAEVVREGLVDRDVKRGRGGIRDIEFSVQLLQLVHGRSDPALRERATVPALLQLVNGGYVDPDEADILIRAYEVFRTVEHRLQLVAERQVHAVPEDRARRGRLARSMGSRGEGDVGATERFDRRLAIHRLAVRRVHETWYFRPLLDAFATASDARGPATTAMTAARLSAFGFRDAARTEQAVQELTAGLTRRSRLMRQLLPLVLDWLSEGPDPDRGLLGLRRLASGSARQLVAAFRDSAETARQLCQLLATTPWAADVLSTNPDLVERLDDVARLRTASRAELRDAAWSGVEWRSDLEDRQASLARWYQRNLLGVVARDLAGHATVMDIGGDLTDLTDVAIDTALRVVDPQVPFSVVAMGRLGGRSMQYASDVDLVFVFDGGRDEFAEAERAATALLRFLKAPTPATRIVTVDPDLRPEGRKGPLARSLDSYTVYLSRWAEVWERQALLRARHVAGDDEVGSRFASLVRQAVWEHPPTPTELREIRRIKARIETERIAPGIEPWRHIKLGPGALVDIEWVAQLTQWRHGLQARGTLSALDRIAESGVLDPLDVATLDATYRWCEHLRNRAWLTTGNGDLIPEAHEPLGVLARSLDRSPTDLVEQHRRLLRRSRRVVTRLLTDP